ncbi:hypothetical protein ACN38_g1430 [Penicillium nordicum]|uniref:Uncharacterized protein n=1 Tax=Penicillium nordicum TaxID=229535 RepID=A0A0M8P8Y0_9EURO|nr:hypothetical protein ACN38_g1430 [Penicillium nordicum]
MRSKAFQVTYADQYMCWVPGCLRPRAPLGTDPLCAVDSLSLSFSPSPLRPTASRECYSVISPISTT